MDPVLVSTEGDGARRQAPGDWRAGECPVKALNLKVGKEQYTKRDFERYGDTHKKIS